MVCPINDDAWKALVAKHGDRGAFKIWLENGQEVPNIKNYDAGNLGIITKELQEKSGLPIVVDPTLENSASAVEVDGNITIYINPDKLATDEIINEFGNIFIDILGGLENPINNTGLKKIAGSGIIEAITKNASEGTTQEEINKAALSMALGRTGEELFSNPAQAKLFDNWVTGFYRRLNKKTNITKEEGQALTKEPVNVYKTEKLDASAIERELYESFGGPNYENLSKKEQLAKQAMQIIETKIQQLERTLDPKNKSQAGALAKLKKLYKDFERKEAEAALTGFVKTAESQLQTVEDKFQEYLEGKSDPTIKGIKYLRDAMVSFDPKLLKDVRDDLDASETELKGIINNAIIKQGRIHDMYKTLAAKYIVQEINPNVEIITSRYKRDAEIEFNSRYRDIKGKDRQQKLDEFTEKYLEDNKEQLEADKAKYLENFLTIINKDISAFDMWVGNPKDLNNDVVRTVAALFDEQDFKARMDNLVMVKQAEAVYQRYVNYIGKTSDQKKQWEPLLANKMKTDEQGNVIKEKGKPIETDEVAHSLAAKGSKKYQEIKDGKYTGTPVEEMYDLLVAMAKERDKHLPASHRLGNKLPILNKNVFERMSENSIFTVIKEGTIDQFKVRAEDTEFGELTETSSSLRTGLQSAVRVNLQAGEERKMIPIHFRNQTTKESDRSFDVLSLMVMDSFQATEFKYKKEIAHKVEGILDLMKEATVYDRTGLLSRLKTDKHGNPVTKKEVSNVAKAIENIIDNRLYGIKVAGDPQTAKVVAKLKQYSSLINLFGNYISAGANLTQGMAMAFMEGAGGKFFTTKDVLAATEIYRKQTPAMLKDSTSRVDKSKVNLLREYFNVTSEFQGLKDDFSKNNLAKRELNLGLGFKFNATAEHYVQSVAMLAMLRNIKVQNENGEYIDRDGKVVEDKSKAMTLEQAYSVGYQNVKTKETISKEEYKNLTESQKGDYIDGVLHLDKRVATTDRTGDEFNPFKVSQSLRRVNRDLFGNYDKDNKSMLERQAIGSLITHMRGWLEPGFKKRWKGISTVYKRDKANWKGYTTIKNYELRDEDLDYNLETGEFEEGMYTTFFRYISNILGEARALKFKVLSENWKDLTNLERQNVRRVGGELAMLGLALAAFVAAAAALEGEDEDDIMTVMAALYARRLVSELMTYWNPQEWSRTARSPAVTLSLLDSVIDALEQLFFDPSEMYDRGKNKGEYKVAVKFKKITPLRILDKDPKETLKFYMNY